LRSAPDCELVLIVRPTRRSDPTRRINREVLKNNAFGRLRKMLGDDFDISMNRRIVTVAGDVTQSDLGLDDAGRSAIAGCDIFIHSAATVSFDSPLDASVSTNLLGPNNIVATLQELGVSPHLVAVSTCYVAGSRRGDAAEEFLSAHEATSTRRAGPPKIWPISERMPGLNLAPPEPHYLQPRPSS
ncbi:MAG: SDR family oxidoreductase, partial [Acidimicrobiales bacterium]